MNCTRRRRLELAREWINKVCTHAKQHTEIHFTLAYITRTHAHTHETINECTAAAARVYVWDCCWFLGATQRASTALAQVSTHMWDLYNIYGVFVCWFVACFFVCALTPWSDGLLWVLLMVLYDSETPPGIKDNRSDAPAKSNSAGCCFLCIILGGYHTFTLTHARTNTHTHTTRNTQWTYTTRCGWRAREL